MKAAEHRREIVRLLKRHTGRYRITDLFTDWVEAAAVAIANAHPIDRRQDREDDYQRLKEKHGDEVMAMFGEALAHVTMALEDDLHDCLGTTYHELDAAATDLGQYFTPIDVSRLMANLVYPVEEVRRHVEERGFVTLHEPTCGAGGMVIAFVDTMLSAGLNPQTQLHVTAWDIDRTAAHMTLVQLGLLHIPATIVTGNTITLESYDVSHTPAHHMGLWQYRLNATSDGLQPVTAPVEPVVLLAQASLFEAAP